jgi:hypothetical protein
MEISTASMAGPLRLALQVISNQRKPVIEVYWELRNVFRPPQEYDLIGIKGESTGKATHRFQDIFTEFALINIGGVRAEQVELELTGDFSYHMGMKKLSQIRIFRDAQIPQLAPAQRLHLFRIDATDFFLYSDGKNIGAKQDTFTIIVRYDGPNKGLNRITRWWANVRGTHQYESSFIFDPRCLDGLDLPQGEYV